MQSAERAVQSRSGFYHEADSEHAWLIRHCWKEVQCWDRPGT